MPNRKSSPVEERILAWPSDKVAMLDQSSIQNHSISKARTSLRPIQFVTGKDPTSGTEDLIKTRSLRVH
ncbi:MAG: hypothetical protein CMI17_09775 [Opitutaceae bacterium]|nr:hypothetical protein [Opitutaceae bacterium]